MGMFDKDKEIGTLLTSLFAIGEPFILYGVRIKREDYPTEYGPAPQTELRVAKRSNPEETFVVTTLAGSIATKAREAEKSDFPAVVTLGEAFSKKYNRKATVLNFLKPYDPTENGRQANLDSQVPPTAPRPDDDIPF